MSDITEQDDNKKETLFSKYQTLMAQKPLEMNATQSAIITGGSVVASQYITHVMSPNSNLRFLSVLKMREVIVMALIGASFITPILLTFYYFLGRLKGSATTKLIIDQFVFSPIFNFSIIYFRMFLMDSTLSFGELFSLTLKVCPSAIRTAWLFWIPQRYFTINYVPPTYQIVFGNLCGFVWNIIFSLLLNS